MNKKEQESLADLQHIKKMMEQSSRFVSLSGLSGIAAGVCALVASFFAGKVIFENTGSNQLQNYISSESEYFSLKQFMGSILFLIAVVTFILAIGLAFLFTFLRSKKHRIPLWGTSAQRLMINLAIPLLAGGVYIYKLMEQGSFGLIAPGCLIFYGIALVNASKYTLGEIRYLGYCEIVLGLINLFAIGYGLYFWAIGFGVLHIIYGVYMWNKYERA